MPTTPAQTVDDQVEASHGGLTAELEALEQRFVGLDGDALMMRLKETVRAHLTRLSERDPVVVDAAATDGD